MLKINRSNKPKLQENKDCFASKNKRILKEALISDVNERCSYCAEENISTSGGEIDHFLPKSNFPSQKCEWTNLFWSCGKCNKHKLNKFFGKSEGEKLGKLENQPLKFDDKNYLFEDNFTINIFEGEIIPLNKNAETTISMLNLNSKTRNKIRKREIDSYHKNKDKIEHAKYKELIKYYFSIN